MTGHIWSWRIVGNAAWCPLVNQVSISWTISQLFMCITPTCLRDASITRGLRKTKMLFFNATWIRPTLANNVTRNYEALCRGDIGNARCCVTNTLEPILFWIYLIGVGIRWLFGVLTLPEASNYNRIETEIRLTLAFSQNFHSPWGSLQSSNYPQLVLT